MLASLRVSPKSLDQYAFLAYLYYATVAPLNVKTTLNVKSNAKCKNAKCEKQR